MSKNYCQRMIFILSEPNLDILKTALNVPGINGLVLSLAVDDCAKVCITVVPSSLSGTTENGTVQKVLKYSEDDALEAIPDPPGAHTETTVVEDGKTYNVVTYSEPVSVSWEEYFK